MSMSQILQVQVCSVILHALRYPIWFPAAAIEGQLFQLFHLSCVRPSQAKGLAALGYLKSH